MHPRFPDIVVSLLEQAGKPMAQIAMVRRALQNAGHEPVAREFTDLAFATEEAEIVALARQFVTVI
jgi:hypothetical protein